MKTAILIWTLIYGVVVFAVGLRYYEQNQPLFKTDVVPLTASNAAVVERIGAVPNIAYSKSYFTPQDQLIIVGGNRVRIYNLRNGRHLGDLFTSPNCTGLNRVFGCFDAFTLYHDSHALSDDGRYLATSFNDYSGTRTIRLWNILSGSQVGFISVRQSTTGEMTFFPNSHILLYDNSQRGGLWRYDVETKLLDSVDSDPLKQILHVSADRVYYLTDTNDLKSVGADWQPITHTNNLNNYWDIFISPNEQFVLLQNNSSRLFLHRLADGSQQTLSGYQNRGYDVDKAVFTADGRYMFTASGDGIVLQWDIESNQFVRQLYTGNAYNWHLLIGTADDVLIGQTSERILIWSIETGQVLTEFTIGNYVSLGLTLSPDGRFLVLSDGRILGVRD